MTDDVAASQPASEVERARSIAGRLLARQLPARWAHVIEVARVVALIASHDRSCVDAVSAAWLHDIGYAPQIDRMGFHPLDGARHARAVGMSNAVTGLVAFHTCARVEAQSRGLLATLETEFDDVCSAARDALWVADATTGPDGQRMTLQQRIADIADRYGTDHLVAQCSRQIAPELESAITRVQRRVPAAFEVGRSRVLGSSVVSSVQAST